MSTPSEGHLLSRLQIGKHGRDRYPTPYLNYIKLVAEVGELADAILEHDVQLHDGIEPEVMAHIRHEAADIGLSLHALCDKLGFDLITVMRELVDADTRDFSDG